MMAEANQTGVVPMKRVVEVFGVLRVRWNALSAGRRTSLSAGTLLVLASVLGLAWYMSRTEWRVLFSGLEGRDAAQVTQELAAAGIPFQTTVDGGGVEVPAEMMDKARMQIAAKGMPQSGRLGFELFDKPNWVGSEFDEKVNYQRALEGELEHTISTLGVVHSARVHLVLPQPSLFMSEEKGAKASVVLKLRRASLPQAEVDSIRNLVAGAVENLSPDQVTLVDADGRVNLTSKGRQGAQDDLQQAMEAKLIAMLEPLAGAGNVRATVNVSYDDATQERTDEIYDPTQTALLSTQKSEQTNSGGRNAQGIPGTASNSPASVQAGTVQGSAAPALLQKDSLPVFPQNASGAGQSIREESGTYAITKHLVHTEQGPGRVQRVTTAVVVNDRMMLEGVGKAEHTTWKPRTTEEMHRLETLAQAAVGFEEKRGDQVVIQNVSFTSNASEVRPAGTERLIEETKKLLDQPAALKVIAMGLVGLVLVWFVLKPVAHQAVMILKEPLALSTAGSPAVLEANVIASEVRESEFGPKMQQHLPRETGLEGMEPGPTSREVLSEVTKQIRRQPVQSTRLLESWIAAEAEGE